LDGWTKTCIDNCIPGVDDSQGFAFVLDANADSTGFPSVFSGSPPTNNIRVFGPGNGVENGFTGSGSGTYFVGIDGDYGRSSIEQTINGLIIGNQYTLSFLSAFGQFTDFPGDTQQYWKVDFGSATQSTAERNVPSQGFMGWFNESMNFVASSTSQILKFTAIGGPEIFPNSLPPFAMLDNVRLTEVPGPLPLMGVGAAMAWSRQLRRRTKNTSVTEVNTHRLPR
jgi:hypothetical protein